jgi:hypothetical protein
MVAFWLMFVWVGILSGLPAKAEIQNLYLQSWQLKVLAELLGQRLQLPVEAEGSVGGCGSAGIRWRPLLGLEVGTTPSAAAGRLGVPRG